MFLSDKQVAARYSVSQPTIWRWVNDLAGFPQPIKLSPGCTRWRLSDIEAFEAAPQEPAQAAGKSRGRPRKALA